MTTTEKTAWQVLVRAREIISRPECWTKRALSRDEHGVNLMDSLSGEPHVNSARCAMDARAVCWCPEGAIRKAMGELGAAARFEVLSASMMALYEAFEAVGPDFTGDAWQPTNWSWNDDSDMTHEGVMAAFDYAIQAVAS